MVTDSLRRRDWRLAVAVISGGHFFSHFFLLALPPLFVPLSTEFSLTNAEFGLIISALAIGGLLQAPVGRLVDRAGPKWVLVTGLGVTAGGITLVGVGETYLLVLVFTVLSGVGQSAFHPADYALIDDVVQPSIRGRAFSVHTFSGYAGFAAAPLVVSTLLSVVEWRETLVIVGSAGLVYTLVAIALLPSNTTADTQTASRRVKPTASERTALSVVRNRGILLMICFFLVVSFAGKGVQAFASVIAVDSFGFSESVANTLLTAFFAFGAVGVLVGGALADRYAPRRIIAVTLFVGSTVLLLTVQGASHLTPFLLVFAFGVVGFFTSLMAPSRDRLVSDLSSSTSMGESFGVVFTGGALGSLCGPVALGIVGDFASISLSFVLICLCYMLAGVLVYTVGGSTVRRST